MPRYVAFLRAINVGGRVVKMDRLRALFEQMQFTAVESFIASGNIIFTSSQRSTLALEKRIDSELSVALACQMQTFVRSTADVGRIAALDPFPAQRSASTGSLYVALLRDAPSTAAQAELRKRESAADRFHVSGREFYWHCATQSTDSAFSGTVLEKIIGAPATLRNITTMRRLAAKYP